MCSRFTVTIMMISSSAQVDRREAAKPKNSFRIWGLLLRKTQRRFNG